MTTQIVHLSSVARREDLTADLARHIFDYDLATGVFRWRVKPARRIRAGSVAGNEKEGRVILKINGIPFRAHRVAWLYVTGSWPEFEIDHIDTNSLNNAFGNLRDVSRAVNQQNLRKALRTNKCGELGVSEKPWGYMARIYANKRQIYLGMFRTSEEAHQAYLDAKRKLHKGNTL